MRLSSHIDWNDGLLRNRECREPGCRAIAPLAAPGHGPCRPTLSLSSYKAPTTWPARTKSPMRKFNQERYGLPLQVDITDSLPASSVLCGRIDFSDNKAELATTLLEPVTCYLNAEMAVFRVFCVSQGTPKLTTLVPLGIPDCVNDAYSTRYFRSDPARTILQQRLTKPLFARRGEWLNDQGTPAAATPTLKYEQSMLRQYREELRRYRKEFLVPSNLYYYLGFRFQDTPGVRRSSSIFFEWPSLCRSVDLSLRGRMLWPFCSTRRRVNALRSAVCSKIAIVAKRRLPRAKKCAPTRSVARLRWTAVPISMNN